MLHLLRRLVAEGGVDRQPVVVALDGGEHAASGLIPRGPLALLDEFDLESVEEAFHGRVIQAVATAAHGLPHLTCAQEPLIIISSVLRAVNALLYVEWRCGSG